jgi:hypothetical protein
LRRARTSTRIENSEERQKEKANQDQAEYRGNDVVDEHRNLEVERFLRADDERREHMPGEMDETPSSALAWQNAVQVARAPRRLASPQIRLPFTHERNPRP